MHGTFPFFVSIFVCAPHTHTHLLTCYRSHLVFHLSTQIMCCCFHKVGIELNLKRFLNIEAEVRPKTTGEI